MGPPSQFNAMPAPHIYVNTIKGYPYWEDIPNTDWQSPCRNSPAIFRNATSQTGEMVLPILKSSYGEPLIGHRGHARAWVGTQQNQVTKLHAYSIHHDSYTDGNGHGLATCQRCLSWSSC